MRAGPRAATSGADARGRIKFVERRSALVTWLTHTAVAKPLAIIAIFMAVVAAGIASFFALPINLFPKFNVPVVVVTTAWVGASPNEVELQITRPVEDAVAGLQNIDSLTSTSGQGISSVVITFTDKANPDLIDSEVQRQLATVQGQLPTDPSQAITPITSKVDPNALPIMQLALVSDTLSNTDLYSLANDTLSPQLQQVTGVSQVVHRRRPAARGPGPGRSQQAGRLRPLAGRVAVRSGDRQHRGPGRQPDAGPQYLRPARHEPGRPATGSGPHHHRRDRRTRRSA